MTRVGAMVWMVGLMPVMGFAQEWKAYPYPDAEFTIQFPATPTVEKGTFKSSAGVALPLTKYSARQDHGVYTLNVVDYSSIAADGMATIAEAEKSFGAMGKVTVAIDARVNRSFGRELSVTGPDGSRSAVAIFFVNKHLFTLVGESLPPDAIQRTGDSVRFQESLNFTGDTGGGGFGRFGGRGGGRFNPQAQAACAGKTIGDAVQLNGPGGTVAATCALVARPNQPPGGGPDPGAQQNRPPPPP